MLAAIAARGLAGMETRPPGFKLAGVPDGGLTDEEVLEVLEHVGVALETTPEPVLSFPAGYEDIDKIPDPIVVTPQHLSEPVGEPNRPLTEEERRQAYRQRFVYRGRTTGKDGVRR